jgi:uncharacterized protein YndB with AHSA1/START domain
MNELIIRKRIEVNAPVAMLWKVLTNSEDIPNYMFGCSAETDWTVGSPLLWKGAGDGKLYVKGHIVSIEPPHKLAYTTFDPHSTMPDIPGNYLTMTYSLKEIREGVTCLEVLQGDFAEVAEGRRRYEEIVAGGDSVMQGIKKLAEAQAELQRLSR